MIRTLALNAFAKRLLQRGIATKKSQIAAALPSRIAVNGVERWSLITCRKMARYRRFNEQESFFNSRSQNGDNIQRLSQQLLPKSKKTRLVIAATIAAFLAYSVEKAPVTGRLRLMAVPQSIEILLGEDSDEQIKRQYQGRIYPKYHPKAQQVRKVMEKIIQVSGLKNLDWEVNVIDDPQANAFVLPGGKVYVFSGILPICKNEDGLASVLAHETAHQLARHTGEQLSMVLPLLLVAIPIASLIGDITLARFIVQYAAQLPMQRQREIEADRIGLLLMSKACYNPAEAVRMWQRMSQATEGQPQPPQFASTHPTHKNRITKLQSWMPDAVKELNAAGCAHNAQMRKSFFGLERAFPYYSGLSSF